MFVLQAHLWSFQTYLFGFQAYLVRSPGILVRLPGTFFAFFLTRQGFHRDNPAHHRSSRPIQSGVPSPHRAYASVLPVGALSARGLRDPAVGARGAVRVS